MILSRYNIIGISGTCIAQFLVISEVSASTYMYIYLGLIAIDEVGRFS